MVHKVIDRCKETTSTTGAGNLTLTGAVPGYVAMADTAFGLTANGDTSWFCAENGAEWELFLGTRVSATQLARTVVIKSSNGGAPVNFTSPPVVFGTVPAEKISTVGPSFIVSKSSGQALPVGAWAKLTFQVEAADTGGCFDAVTNHRFQPNVAGYYQLNGTLSLTANVTLLSVAVFKNGSQAVQGGQSNASFNAVTVAGLVYMNGTTDYVELWGYSNSAATTTHGVSGVYFGGYLAAIPGAPMLAPIVAPGPSFHAYLGTANQALTSGVVAKVAFNFEEFDNGNCFDVVTNRRFQPNVEGYYNVSWCVRIDAPATTLVDSASILYKNGASYKLPEQVGSVMSSVGVGASALVYMNGTTDYLEVFAFAIGTTPRIAFGADRTFFSAFLAALPQVPQPTTGPAFSAYRASEQTGVANNTYVKVQLNAEEFDTASCFDSTTNFRFTPNVAGYYSFEWSLDCRGTSLSVGYAELRKNGISKKSGSLGAATASVAVSTGSGMVYMNGTTDYVELWGYVTASSNHRFASGEVATFLSGSWVRPG